MVVENLIPNFTWDLVTTSFHDPEKVLFNFSSYEMLSSYKDILSKDFVLLFHLSKWIILTL